MIGYNYYVVILLSSVYIARLALQPNPSRPPILTPALTPFIVSTRVESLRLAIKSVLRVVESRKAYKNPDTSFIVAPSA